MAYNFMPVHWLNHTMKDVDTLNQRMYHKAMNDYNITSNVLREHNCLEHIKTYCETIFDELLARGQYNMKSMKSISSDNMSDIDVDIILAHSIENRDASSSITIFPNGIYTTGTPSTTCDRICKTNTANNRIYKSSTVRNVICKSSSTRNRI